MPVLVRVYQLLFVIFKSMEDDCRKRVYQWPIHLFISMVDACRDESNELPIYACRSENISVAYSFIYIYGG